MSPMRPDCDLKRDIKNDRRTGAVDVIKRALPYSWEGISVVVENGENELITLEGEVEWHYQRERAGGAVQKLCGARSVINFIEVRPRVVPLDIKNRIAHALRQAAEIDASLSAAQVNGGEVILGGSVRSWAERRPVYARGVVGPAPKVSF
jgi:osmotically-inducible protein OsmY